MGLPLLSIVALQQQPTWGGLQKGYVFKKKNLAQRQGRFFSENSKN